MAEQHVEVVNELGLHARPASKIAQLSSKYLSEIAIRHGEVSVNAKSVLGILTLAAPKGSQIVIEAEGEDADEALQALSNLFSSGFDE